MAVIFEQKKEEEKEKKIHSQVKKLFYTQLIREERARRIKYAGCPSLVPVYCSPWRKLFYSGDESALITVTGFNYKTFLVLNDRFKILFHKLTLFGQDEYSLWKVESKRDCKRVVESEDCLGLVLTWTWTRGFIWPLLLIFGITLSTLKRYLKFAQVVLLECLKTNSNIPAKLPDKEDQVSEFVNAIGLKYSLLYKERVFAAMYRLKLYLEQSGNHVIQNTFNTGWKHDHYMGNIFLFTLDEMI
eukprot:10542655-Ditylum_brightwellii.AAC.1